MKPKGPRPGIVDKRSVEGGWIEARVSRDPRPFLPSFTGHRNGSRPPARGELGPQPWLLAGLLRKLVRSEAPNLFAFEPPSEHPFLTDASEMEGGGFDIQFRICWIFVRASGARA